MKIFHKIMAKIYAKKMSEQHSVSRWDFEMFRYHQARSRRPQLHEIGNYEIWYPKPSKSVPYYKKK